MVGSGFGSVLEKMELGQMIVGLFMGVVQLDIGLRLIWCWAKARRQQKKFLGQTTLG